VTISRPLPHGAPNQTPRRIVVHAMAHQIDDEGKRVYAATYLDRVGLSAHILVAPDGTLIRCRQDCEGAYHAKGYNTDSLGIEVLVPNVYSYTPFVERIKEPWVGLRQLTATVDQVADWCREYGIKPERGQLDRHSDIDPERKVDPGQGFPWYDFTMRVRARIESLDAGVA